MDKIQYCITLYYSRHFSELLTYYSPVLPVVGDFIEVLEERTMFIVERRSFKTHQNRGLVPVTLYGTFENGEDIGQHKYEKMRERIQDAYQGVRRTSEGFVILPDTLD